MHASIVGGHPAIIALQQAPVPHDLVFVLRGRGQGRNGG
tara:strand:- start:501 stop:617 length:117 start_codon:yes stop_codon:yes gene_type:complete